MDISIRKELESITADLEFVEFIMAWHGEIGATTEFPFAEETQSEAYKKKTKRWMRKDFGTKWKFYWKVILNDCWKARRKMVSVRNLFRLEPHAANPNHRPRKEEKDRKLTKHKEELRQSQQDTARQARRTTRKAVLVELGVSRALKVVSSRGLPARVLPLLEWEVRGRLETLLIGDETPGQANETIEASIEGPLCEWTIRMEQLETAKRERVLDECLTLAGPIAEATWPWVKDFVIKQLCEKSGIQPSPDLNTHTNEERGSSETSHAPANVEQPTRRTVRRREVRPNSSAMNADQLAGTSEPVVPTFPEQKRAAS